MAALVATSSSASAPASCQAAAARAATGSGHPRIGFALLVLAALGFGGWGLWRAYGPQPANAADLLRQQAARIDALQQDVATLKRSDQISRQANTE